MMLHTECASILILQRLNCLWLFQTSCKMHSVVPLSRSRNNPFNICGEKKIVLRINYNVFDIIEDIVQTKEYKPVYDIILNI